MDDTQSPVSIQEVIESLAPQTDDADEQQDAGGEPDANNGGQEEAQDAQQGGQEEAQDDAQDDAGEQESAGVSDEQVEAVRTLLADGWTREELLAFAEDEGTKKELREGRSLRQAALSYLRRQGAAEKGARKRGAPIARNTSAGGTQEMDPVKSMSDAQYDRFMADVRRRAMRGEKVKL